jgi:hypothetical protein
VPAAAALIDEVRATCTALSTAGFRDLLLHVTGGALDITAADLAGELSKPLATIDRDVPAFADFALEGQRGIEPGSPARSLLYHALASPCVSRLADGSSLRGYPTLTQIEAVEDYVYGVSPPTLDKLVAEERDGAIGVVVFAVEYRPGAYTPHKRHADLCLSRTGIARVGTAPASYDAAGRQFEPLDETDPYAFRVLPVRYAPFVAVQRRGENGELPNRFVDGDDERLFWVPLHKLFPGRECIAGLDLEVTLTAHQVNEKIRRFHAAMNARGYDTGWGGTSDLDNPPFRFTEGIAELSEEPEHGPGLLVPAVHERLIEPAVYDGKPLSLSVPKGLKPEHRASHVLDRYFSSLEILPGAPYAIQPGQMVPPGRSHASPEYVNGRHQLLADGTEVNLNDRPDVWDIVSAGGYQARHFVDFTGDGWMEVTCPQLDHDMPRRVAAYSVVAAPDFFPYCDQLQLMEWWSTVPPVLGEGLWAVHPKALCDTRFAPNVTLAGSGFDAPDGSGLDDTTVTAVLCPPGAHDAAPAGCPEPDVQLRSALPDGASGVFDPGWDVTTDTLPVDPGDRPPPDSARKLFLAGYGLGTPFVEDAKICAALGTYWPSVSPDSTRTYQPDKYWPTISPLTDEEIGIVGEMPWDGIKGPVRIDQGPDQPAIVECLDIDYADYVDQVLAGKLTAALTAKIDAAEYTRRTLAMACVYWALGLRLPGPTTKRGKKRSFNQRVQIFLFEKAEWNVLSFRAVGDGQPEGLRQAVEDTKTSLEGSHVYAFELFRHGADAPSPSSFKLRHVEIVEEAQAYTDLVHVYLSRAGAPWTALAIPTS